MNRLSVSPTPASPAQGLTREDFKPIKDFLDRRISANTRASYRSVWTIFQARTLARTVLAMPASPALVPAYLSRLVEEHHLTVATDRLHRAALAAIHKINGHSDPTDDEGFLEGPGRPGAALGLERRPPAPLRSCSAHLGRRGVP